MRKFIYTLVILAFAVSLNAQWQSDVRLTNYSGASWTSSNNARCIAVDVNVVHVVWLDYRDFNYEIYYKRSTDGGTIWASDTRLTNNSYRSEYPSIAVSGSLVHVVWFDNRDGNNEIYYKRSTDGGINWGADTRLTNNTANSQLPSITVTGSIVNVIWEDNRDGNYEIYSKRSTDGGINWGADSRLTNNTASSERPSIAVSGSFVNVVWYDYRDGNYEIYYKRSTDGGINWEGDTRLTNDSAESRYLSIAVSGTIVHVVWNDNRDGNEEVYYKRSTDGGINWETDTRLTNDTSYTEGPSIAVSGTLVHVVWQDNRDGNAEIYYKRSTDGGINWGADTRLTNNTAGSIGTFIALSGTIVHVIWCDLRDGNWEIYYKRDPTGNPTGIINVNSEIPSSYSLSQNYPNPFNPTTKIKFDVVRVGDVKIIVYDVMGREVQTIVNESLKPGTYEATFNGSMLTSGVYFYKLITDGFTETKKMLMIK